MLVPAFKFPKTCTTKDKWIDKDCSSREKADHIAHHLGIQELRQ